MLEIPAKGEEGIEEKGKGKEGNVGGKGWGRVGGKREEGKGSCSWPLFPVGAKDTCSPALWTPCTIMNDG